MACKQLLFPTGLTGSEANGAAWSSQPSQGSGFLPPQVCESLDRRPIRAYARGVRTDVRRWMSYPAFSVGPLASIQRACDLAEAMVADRRVSGDVRCSLRTEISCTSCR